MESGQAVAPEVIDALFTTTRGQPGLVGWLGELLTERYNPGAGTIIEQTAWREALVAAHYVEPNNTILNLVKKAQGPHRDRVMALFGRADMPFAFEDEADNYLYLNGVIEPEKITGESGEPRYVCRFSSPFVQLRLYNDFTRDLFESRLPSLVLDPFDRLAEVFQGPEIDTAALLDRYRAYLGRLSDKGLDPWQAQPRRSDLHLTEAVGHFHLYAWLKEALGRRCVVSPEFPTGNGKVDLCLQAGDKWGIIEIKSFTSAPMLDEGRAQAARYAARLGLSAAALCVFVPVRDEAVLAALSGSAQVEGVRVTVVAIGWG
jgi:hypothetical protein